MSSIPNSHRKKSTERGRHRSKSGEQQGFMHAVSLLQRLQGLSEGEGEGLGSGVLEGELQRAIGLCVATIEDVVQPI